MVNVFVKSHTSASIEFASENAAKALIRKGTTVIGKRTIKIEKFIPWAASRGYRGPNIEYFEGYGGYGYSGYGDWGPGGGVIRGRGRGGWRGGKPRPY